MRLNVLSTAIFFSLSLTLTAADPTATNYTFERCLGTHLPYPEVEELVALPDSLSPVALQHVGRHGARFPSSPKNCLLLREFLTSADSTNSLSPLGKQLLAVTTHIEEECRNRWGALDSLGMAEVRGIGSRMFRAYPRLFTQGVVTAISSYAPRCVMSMYETLHQIDRLNNRIETVASTGRQNSPLMRPFDVDQEYIDWVASRQWEPVYTMAAQTQTPTAPARRLLTGDAASAMTTERAQEIARAEYGLLSGMAAMSLPVDLKTYFSAEEINALWAVDNLRHYLMRSANTLSVIPADICAPLLQNIIADLEAAAEAATMGDAADAPTAPVGAVVLRFGHAETLLPLLSLMRLNGCYYMTNYFDTVALHWRDFDITPMAANLQLLLVRSTTGNLYLRVDLNEKPLPLLPNSDTLYTPWYTARDYLTRCLPEYLQI